MSIGLLEEMMWSGTAGSNAAMRSRESMMRGLYCSPRSSAGRYCKHVAVGRSDDSLWYVAIVFDAASATTVGASTVGAGRTMLFVLVFESVTVSAVGLFWQRLIRTREGVQDVTELQGGNE